jgi:hypothetical protein
MTFTTDTLTVNQHVTYVLSIENTPTKEWNRSTNNVGYWCSGISIKAYPRMPTTQFPGDIKHVPSFPTVDLSNVHVSIGAGGTAARKDGGEKRGRRNVVYLSHYYRGN